MTPDRSEYHQGSVLIGNRQDRYQQTPSIEGVGVARLAALAFGSDPKVVAAHSRWPIYAVRNRLCDSVFGGGG